MNQFLNTLTDYVCIVNAQRRVVFINDSMYKCLGYENDKDNVLDLESIVQIKYEEGCSYVLGRTKQGKVLKGDATIHTKEGQDTGCAYVKVNWERECIQQVKESLLEKFIDKMTEGVCIKDHKGTYIFVNRAYAKRLGYPKEQVIGKNDDDFWSEGYCQQFKNDDDYVRKTGSTCVIEEKIDGDRGKKYYETTKFPLVDDEKYSGYVGIVMKNVTISKELIVQQLEVSKQLNYIQQLVSNENVVEPYNENMEQLKTLMETCFKTPNITIRLYNETENYLERYIRFGVSSNEKYCRNAIKITPQELRKWTKNNCNLILKVKEVELEEDIAEYLKSIETKYIVVYEILHKGELMGILSAAYKHKPKGVIARRYLVNMMCMQLGLIIHNSKLKTEVEKELYERHRVEKELKAFLEISADLIIQVDHRGRYEKVSTACIHSLGWSEEELVGMGAMNLVHPEDKDMTNEIVLQCKQKNQTKYPLHITNRFRCKDGSYKWLRWNAKYIEENAVFLVTAKDITYEKQLQEREQNAQKILQLEQVRNEFFANLSHEFKTPLTIILSVIKLFERTNSGWTMDEEIEASCKRYVGMIKQNSYRLLRLVNNLIDVTKIDAGYLEINLQNYNIVSLVEDIVLSVVDYAKDKNIDVIFDTDTEEEVVACDLDMIERIMLNLLSNAIKYANQKGEIQVNVSTEQQMILIEVKDDGMGIPEDKLELIFERFIQVGDVLNRKCEGSGIGLSLIKSLVEMHKGSINVESKENIGTVFSVRLPRTTVQNSESRRNRTITDAEVRSEKCYIEFSDIYA